MAVKKQIADFGVSQAIKMLRSNPEMGYKRLLSIMDLVAHGSMPSQRARIREGLEDPDSNVRQMVQRALNEIDPSVFSYLVSTMAIDASLASWSRQEEMREKYQCNIPWAILLDPTSACNLHCIGCWAADYGYKLNLSYEEMDSIVNQGVELGVHFYIFTGGEPLVRKKDIIRLCENHQDCIFLSFTNGTLVDDAFCREVLRVKNFVPAFSVEGNEEVTDARRGEGTYKRVTHGMELMHQYGLPFGISCCYTSQNYESVSSDDFIHQLIDWGALFVWYFHYMPVGSDANTHLMVTPEQRESLYHVIRRWRETEPIFPMDFQNDGQFVQGCIAGGRRYMHINAAGDVDPCVFIHFSDSNIREKSLLECLQSPLFMAYHDMQPFNDNYLRPCPMLENPDKLREIIHKTGAKSSNLEGEETVEELCSRCDKYAEHWVDTANKLWEENHVHAPFSR